MKKIFKIIGIIIIVILVLIAGVFGYTKIKEMLKDNERKNANTLMEYVKTHSYEYIDNSDETMYFTAESLMCDTLNILDNTNIKGIITNYGTNMTLLLNDNSYISLSMDETKLYSNNQHCKKTDINIDIDIKDIKWSDNGELYYLISDDNKIYYNYTDSEGKFNFKEMQTTNDLISYILLKDDIQGIITYNNGTYPYAIVLKKDGSLYKQKYNGDYDYNTFETTYSTISDELFLSNNEYGNILNATLNYNYDKDEYEINTLITDKGYYYYGEVKTEECTKYQDIKCEKKIMESEIYKTFKKDIKYIGNTYTILNDNSIIQTSYLTYPLDKDLKN